MSRRLHALPVTRRAFAQAAAALAALNLALAAAPAHAGLLDLVRGSDPPLVVQDDSDLTAALQRALDEKNVTVSPRESVRRVGISAFEVRFVTDSSLTQTKRRMGLGTTGDSRASVAYQLQAPSPEVYQALTDQLRDAMEKAIAERGYEVVGAATLGQDADFAAKVAATPAAAKADPSFFSRTGAIVVHATGTADTFGFMGDATEMHLSGRLGPDVALLKIRLVVNFASMEEMGFAERAANGGGAGIEHQVGLTVDGTHESDELSRLVMVTPSGGWPRTFRRTVQLPDPIAKEVKKADIGNGERALGVLRTLMGSSGSSVKYVVTPADDYAARLQAGLTRVVRMMAVSLAPVR